MWIAEFGILIALIVLELFSYLSVYDFCDLTAVSLRDDKSINSVILQAVMMYHTGGRTGECQTAVGEADKSTGRADGRDS